MTTKLEVGSFELSVLIEAHLSAVSDTLGELITASDLDNEELVEEAHTSIEHHSVEASRLMSRLGKLLAQERKQRLDERARNE